MKTDRWLASELYEKPYKELNQNADQNRFMLETVHLLQQAAREAWQDDELAQILKVDSGHIDLIREKFSRAIQVTEQKSVLDWLTLVLEHILRQSPIVEPQSRQQLQELLDQIIQRIADLEEMLNHFDQPLDKLAEQIHESQKSD
jgi:vacuolar-type H+-ATPase subunit I/STV1